MSCTFTCVLDGKRVEVYEAELNLFDESSGTKKLFGLMPFIADSLLSGTTLVIDELDAKIHPVADCQPKRSPVPYLAASL